MVDTRQYKVDLTSHKDMVEGHLRAIYGRTREGINLQVLATLDLTQEERLGDGYSLTHTTLHTLWCNGDNTSELAGEVHRSTKTLRLVAIIVGNKYQSFVRHIFNVWIIHIIIGSRPA